MGRLLRPVIAGALVLMALVPFGAEAGAPLGDDLGSCSVEGQITQRRGWTEIKTPTYSHIQGNDEGPDVIAASALPQRREWVYVTNGRVLRLSTDAGCKFDHVYRPQLGGDDTGTPSNDSRVLSHLSAPTASSIWIAGYDSDGDLPRPHVTMTPDATPVPGNKTTAPFRTYDLGLPVAGKPYQLLATSRTDEAYLLVDEPRPGADALTNPIRRLYRTTVNENLKPSNLAVSWEQLTLPAGFGNPQGVRTSDGQILWTWSGTKYARSMDRGATWTPATAAAPITEIDVNVKGVATLFLKHPDGVSLEQARDPGVLGTSRSVPIEVTHAVHGTRGGVYGVTGPKGTYGFDVATRSWADLGLSGVQLSALHMGLGSGGRILVGETADKLYRFDLWAREAFRAPSKEDLRFGDGEGLPESDLTGPVLDVTREDITVAPREVAQSVADFGMNPRPQPIDVFFLMDTTMSMARAIEDLQGSVKKLAADLKEKSKGEACFGLGEFKDFTARADEHSNSAIAYQLHQKITCDNLDLLESNLKKLHQAGGSGPEEEAGTLALTTAVTGNASANPPITPGQDAGFVHKTRVIVLISDAGFMEGTSLDQGTYPTIPKTIETLQAYNTKVVSILVNTDNDFAAAYEDMEAVSEGTDTVAPAEGVDCDGSGKPDLQPGAPLVCDTSGETPDLAPAIVALLLGIKDPGTMAIEIHDEHDVVKKIDGKPKTAKNVRLSELKNFRLENHLIAKLTLSCSADQDGKDLPVRVVAGSGVKALLQKEIVVHCRAPKIPPKIVPPRVIPPQIPPAPEVVPPPVPRPPIVLPAAPVFQPPAPNNPISNVNPNAGFSQQEEQQFQLAPVTNSASDEVEEATEEVDLAMSAVSRDDPAAQAVLGCAMLMTAAAAGTVYANRRRTQRSMRAAYVRYR